MENKKILKIILIISILLIIVDQASKILVDKFAPDNFVIFDNVLEISKTENEGVAFGTNQNNTTNIFLSILVLAVVIRFVIVEKDKLDTKNTVFISLIIAGGFSNLIDRLIRGAVFDFIKIEGFTVFNLADAFIVIGWVLFVIDFFGNIMDIRKIQKDMKKNNQDSKKTKEYKK